MRESRLFQLLQALDKQECRMFDKWVRSPAINQREDVAQLWATLKPLLADSDKQPDRKWVFKKVYGAETAFDDHRLRMCMSFLVKCCEEFLVWQQVQHQGLKKDIFLATALRERGLEKSFDRHMGALRAQLEQEPLRNSEYLENLYLMEMEGLRAAAGQARTTGLPFQEIHDSFDQAYLAQKLRQACVALSHQAVYRTDYDFGMLPLALQYVEQKQLTEVPAIAAYYHAFHMMQGAPEGYAQFSACLETQLQRFPESEQRELILHAINHCIRQYNSGNSNYLSEELVWYKKGLESGVLLINGVLSRFTYRNVTTLALILGDLDWAETFILKFRENLEPAHREANFSFNLARLEYKKGNYGQTLALLQQSDYEDTLLALAAKTVLLKVFYETGALDALYSHLDAMQAFIRRHHQLGYHSENYRQLIRFTRLLAAMAPGKSADKQRLRQEIEATKALAEKNWLLEQI